MDSIYSNPNYNVRRLPSSDLLEYDRLRRQQNATWKEINWDEVELISGSGSEGNKTYINIVSSHPVWKELFFAQRKEQDSYKKDTSYSDVILIADDGELPIHRVFLKDKSPFLEDLIKECSPGEGPSSHNKVMITLVGSKLKHLKVALTLLYTGVTVYDYAEEADIKAVMRMLQIDNLRLKRFNLTGKKPKLLYGLRERENIELNEATINGNIGSSSSLVFQPSLTSSLSDASNSQLRNKRSKVLEEIPLIQKVQPGTLTSKAPKARIQRKIDDDNLGQSDQNDGERLDNSKPRSSGSELERLPVIEKVAPGSLFLRHKQPRIKRPVPTSPESGREEVSAKILQNEGEMGKTGNDLNDVEDVPSPQVTSRYERDSEYVPSPSDGDVVEEDEEVDVEVELAEVMELESSDDENLRRPLTRNQAKTKSMEFENGDNQRYPKRKRARTCKESDDIVGEKVNKQSRSEKIQEGRRSTRMRTRQQSGAGSERGSRGNSDNCPFCDNTFAELEDLSSHLDNTPCGRHLTGLYCLEKKECRTCLTSFVGYTIEEFFRHVDICVCSAKPSYKRKSFTTEPNEEKGTAETVRPENSVPSEPEVPASPAIPSSSASPAILPSPASPAIPLSPASPALPSTSLTAAAANIDNMNVQPNVKEEVMSNLQLVRMRKYSVVLDVLNDKKISNIRAKLLQRNLGDFFQSKLPGRHNVFHARPSAMEDDYSRTKATATELIRVETVDQNSGDLNVNPSTTFSALPEAEPSGDLNLNPSTTTFSALPEAEPSESFSSNSTFEPRYISTPDVESPERIRGTEKDGRHRHRPGPLSRKKKSVAPKASKQKLMEHNLENAQTGDGSTDSAGLTNPDLNFDDRSNEISRKNDIPWNRISRIELNEMIKQKVVKAFDKFANSKKKMQGSALNSNLTRSASAGEGTQLQDDSGNNLTEQTSTGVQNENPLNTSNNSNKDEMSQINKLSRNKQNSEPNNLQFSLQNSDKSSRPIATEPSLSQPAAVPPSQPAAVPPSQPAAVPPSQPAAAHPCQPASVPPSQPAAAPPSQPAAAPPRQSASSLPSQPAAAPPRQSASSLPSQPAAAPPRQSASSLPSQPGSAPPSQPASALPSQPASAPPSQPASALPSQPASALPNQPAPAPRKSPAAFEQPSQSNDTDTSRQSSSNDVTNPGKSVLVLTRVPLSSSTSDMQQQQNTNQMYAAGHGLQAQAPRSTTVSIAPAAVRKPLQTAIRSTEPRNIVKQPFSVQSASSNQGVVCPVSSITQTVSGPAPIVQQSSSQVAMPTYLQTNHNATSTLLQSNDSPRCSSVILSSQPRLGVTSSFPLFPSVPQRRTNQCNTSNTNLNSGSGTQPRSSVGALTPSVVSTHTMSFQQQQQQQQVSRQPNSFSIAQRMPVANSASRTVVVRNQQFLPPTSAQSYFPVTHSAAPSPAGPRLIPSNSMPPMNSSRLMSGSRFNSPHTSASPGVISLPILSNMNPLANSRHLAEEMRDRIEREMQMERHRQEGIQRQEQLLYERRQQMFREQRRLLHEQQLQRMGQQVSQPQVHVPPSNISSVASSYRNVAQIQQNRGQIEANTGNSAQPVGFTAPRFSEPLCQQCGLRFESEQNLNDHIDQGLC